MSSPCQNSQGKKGNRDMKTDEEWTAIQYGLVAAGIAIVIIVLVSLI